MIALFFSFCGGAVFGTLIVGIITGGKNADLDADNQELRGAIHSLIHARDPQSLSDARARAGELLTNAG